MYTSLSIRHDYNSRISDFAVQATSIEQISTHAHELEPLIKGESQKDMFQDLRRERAECRPVGSLGR